MLRSALAAVRELAADPFLLPGPAVVSFSGGRTSAYMLRRLMLANPGLPGVRVVFANTGLEEPETLDFVEECAQRWGVCIDWVEYAEGGGVVVTDHRSASRSGEPFSALIAARKFLPNPVARFCTAELKVRTMDRFLANFPAFADGEYDCAVGIRADESRRVARIRARAASGKDGARASRVVMPLAVAGVTVEDVHTFWLAQKFGLRLASDGRKTFAGNCSLCFMKPAAQLQALIREKPARATWWIAAEASVTSSAHGMGGRFRNDRPSYEVLAARAGEPDLFGDADDEVAACMCGDDA